MQLFKVKSAKQEKVIGQITGGSAPIPLDPLETNFDR